jgi:hypothetical protein
VIDAVQGEAELEAESNKRAYAFQVGRMNDRDIHMQSPTVNDTSRSVASAHSS